MVMWQVHWTVILRWPDPLYFILIHFFTGSVYELFLVNVRWYSECKNTEVKLTALKLSYCFKKLTKMFLNKLLLIPDRFDCWTFIISIIFPLVLIRVLQTAFAMWSTRNWPHLTWCVSTNQRHEFVSLPLHHQQIL